MWWYLFLWSYLQRFSVVSGHLMFWLQTHHWVCQPRTFLKLSVELLVSSGRAGRAPTAPVQPDSQVTGLLWWFKLRIHLPMQGTRVWSHVQGPGRFHMPWSIEVHAPRVCAPQQEKPLRWEACVWQLEIVSSCSLRLGKDCAAMKIQHSHK